MLEKKRQGLIVYLYYNRDARKLSKFGDVIYHSRRLKYLHLYMDQDLVAERMDEIAKLRFVKSVKPSYFDEIDMDFVGSLYR